MTRLDYDRGSEVIKKYSEKRVSKLDELQESEPSYYIDPDDPEMIRVAAMEIEGELRTTSFIASKQFRGFCILCVMLTCIFGLVMGLLLT